MTARRPSRALELLAAVWTVYLVYAVVQPGLGLETVFKTYVFSAMPLAAGGLSVYRAVVIDRDRPTWALLGAGMISWGLGSVYWSAFLKSQAAPPYPSPADGLYLAFYPCAYIALARLIRPRVRGLTPSMWLDGLVGMLAVGALGAAFAVPEIVDLTSGSRAAIATNLAYPLGDLVLMALVIGGCVLTAWRAGRVLTVIGAGFLVFGAADTVYLLQVAAGTFHEGTWLDAMWPAGMILLTFAAWHDPRSEPAPVGSLAPVVAAPVPLVLALSALGLLALGNAHSIGPAAVALASATLVVALARLMLSLGEIRALGESRRLATTDELTGLPNRPGFYARLTAEMAAAEERGTPIALIVADFNSFKEVNDALGHLAGDELLQQFGPRVQTALGSRDFFARTGGDEFAVLLPGRDAAAAEAVLAEMAALLDEPFRIDGLPFHVEAAWGVAAFPEHVGDADALVQGADAAMLRAKETGTLHRVYAAEHDAHSREKLELLADLRLAIGAGQLELHYQPKVDLRTDMVSGVEALVRWNHPQRGFLPPGAFLPLVERLPLMRPLTQYVLDVAVAQAAAWRDAGHDLSVAVNLAVPNLLDTSLPDEVRSTLARHGLPPERLCLEVTENIILTDPERILGVLVELKETGVTISLDDFGAGSSSLAYLKRLPLDELKIDRSFVFAMDTSPSDEIIVRSTTDLAQRLGMRVVAEGIETPAALERLRNSGCDDAQGYFYSRPVPPGELIGWIEARTPQPPTPFVANVGQRTA